jgi:3-oxoacyl-[acyl-carrier protein] reductase
VQLDGFEGRVALVTGGAQGIGRRMVETFRDLGARSVAADIVEAAIPGALGVTMDVTDEESVAAAFDRVERELGVVQILVLNAGVLVKSPLEEHSLADWRRVLEVNLSGPFICARRAMGPMRGSGYGRVVVIGSSAGISGAGAAPPALPAYAASKAGVMALAKSMAGEYAAHGITVNALAPTLIDTGMLSTLTADLRSGIPVGRYGTPQEIADLTAFLCSAHAGYITGEVVDINGGYLID